MIGIYKITSQSGKIYIGQSIDIENRFRRYRRLLCKPQTRLYNSFLKYGVENHIFEIVEECSIDNLYSRERFYQLKNNCISKNGLNCIIVSANEEKAICSKETIEKLRTINLGKKISQETKDKIRVVRTGSKMSIESSEKKRIAMSGENNHFYGKKHSEQSIAIIKQKNSLRTGDKNNFYGIEHSEKTKKILSEKRLLLIETGFIAYSKSVINLNTGVKYKSLAELCRCENLNYRNAISGIHNKLKKYNYIKYEN